MWSLPQYGNSIKVTVAGSSIRRGTMTGFAFAFAPSDLLFYMLILMMFVRAGASASK